MGGLQEILQYRHSGRARQGAAVTLRLALCLTSRLTLLLTLVLGAATTRAAEFDSDTHRSMLIVDQSGSMGHLEWLASTMQLAYERMGADVEFAGADGAHAPSLGLIVYTGEAERVDFDGEPFGLPEQVAERLAARERGSAGLEDGYQALRLALAAEQPFGHVLLVTDEDRDVVNDRETFERILQDLEERSVQLDAVVRVDLTCADGRKPVAVLPDGTGYVLEQDVLVTCTDVRIRASGGNAETTVPDYVELAQRTGGTVWRLSPLRDEGTRRQRERRSGSTLPLALGDVLAAQALERNPRTLVAHASVQPAQVSSGELVTLNGAGSFTTDEGVYLTAWSWDLDGDGEEDARGDVVATSFDRPGERWVVLRVRDSEGRSARTRVRLVVE